MKDAGRIRSLFLRRVSPLEVPAHVRVRTRPGRPLIREYSWHLKPRVRALLGTINVLVWAVWLLLLGVVMTSLAWSIGVWMLQHEWIEAQGIRGLSRFVKNDLPVGLAFCVVFLVWASVRAWSTRRIKVARRRAQRVAADQAPPATAANVPSPTTAWDAQLQQACAQQCLVCHHQAGGDLASVDVRELRPSPPLRGMPLKGRLRLSTAEPHRPH
jgi:poly-beta-1,6-N-acetyl-D-glucosamine biosynthesis protein PgaD